MNHPVDMPLVPESLSGRLERIQGGGSLSKADRFVAHEVGDGLLFVFPPGTLEPFAWITLDLILDGETLVVWDLLLKEGEKGRCFRASFGALTHCQARLRLPLAAVNQNVWIQGREGGLLKLQFWNDVVDLSKVDRMEIRISRKDQSPTRWCMTPPRVTKEEPPRLREPLLPEGPLLDRFGQSRQRQWPGKIENEGALVRQIRQTFQDARSAGWPASLSRWGGWRERQFAATGFFRVQNDGRRWWLVDPDGCAFWSCGPDCVCPDVTAACGDLLTALEEAPGPASPNEDLVFPRDATGQVQGVNFLALNLRRTFGPSWHKEWKEAMPGHLRHLGFNTVANWSDWRAASDRGFPYVLPLNPRFDRTPMVFRDFPDVYDPSFAQDAAAFAESLRTTAADPAMIGYFLMNEPSWGFSTLLPAEGMLINAPTCRTRRAFAEWLRDKYGCDQAFAEAWGINAGFAEVADGPWTHPLGVRAHPDLEAFSAVMAQKFFGELAAACRRVDANHLNLGIRCYTVPEAWLVDSMRSFDVFSFNCYDEVVPSERMAALCATLGMPALVGEWHFGALDRGLPATGIGRVATQEARGIAYRRYVEDAAYRTWCVGVHWFTLYDESTLGRGDGENYQIGFIDVCHGLYSEIAAAARTSHGRLYDVADGREAPFGEVPEYLPKLFL